jgi:hypothetical protein
MLYYVKYTKEVFLTKGSERPSNLLKLMMYVAKL